MHSPLLDPQDDFLEPEHLSSPSDLNSPRHRWGTMSDREVDANVAYLRVQTMR